MALLGELVRLLGGLVALGGARVPGGPFTPALVKFALPGVGLLAMALLSGERAVFAVTLSGDQGPYGPSARPRARQPINVGAGLTFCKGESAVVVALGVRLLLGQGTRESFVQPRKRQ